MAAPGSRVSRAALSWNARSSASSAWLVFPRMERTEARSYQASGLSGETRVSRFRADSRRASLLEFGVGVGDGEDGGDGDFGLVEDTVQQREGFVGALHLEIEGGEFEGGFRVGEVAARGFELAQLLAHVSDLTLGIAGGAELGDPVLHIEIVAVEAEGGFGNEQGIVVAGLADQKVGIAEHGFGAVGAVSQGLAEGEVGFAVHALADHGIGFVQVTPGVKAADRAAEFGEGLLGLVVADELAIAVKPS